MPYGIVGIVHTLRQCLITDVHRIASFLRQIGLIGHQTIVLFLLRSLCLPSTSCPEGVFPIVIVSKMLGKAVLGSGTPVAASVYLDIGRARIGHVVINNHLVTLPVSFSGREDDGTGIL